MDGLPYPMYLIYRQQQLNELGKSSFVSDSHSNQEIISDVSFDDEKVRDKDRNLELKENRVTIDPPTCNLFEDDTNYNLEEQLDVRMDVPSERDPLITLHTSPFNSPEASGLHLDICSENATVESSSDGTEEDSQVEPIRNVIRLCVICARDISKVQKIQSVVHWRKKILNLTSIDITKYPVEPFSCSACYQCLTYIENFVNKVHESSIMIQKRCLEFHNNIIETKADAENNQYESPSNDSSFTRRIRNSPNFHKIRKDNSNIDTNLASRIEKNFKNIIGQNLVQKINQSVESPNSNNKESVFNVQQTNNQRKIDKIRMSKISVRKDILKNNEGRNQTVNILKNLGSTTSCYEKNSNQANDIHSQNVNRDESITLLEKNIPTVTNQEKIQGEKQTKIDGINKKVTSFIIHGKNIRQVNLKRNESVGLSEKDIQTFNSTTNIINNPLIPEKRQRKIDNIDKEVTYPLIQPNNIMRSESIILSNKDILEECLKRNRVDHTEDDFSTVIGGEKVSTLPEEKEITVEDNMEITSAVIQVNHNHKQNFKRNISITLPNKDILAECIKINSIGYTPEDNFSNSIRKGASNLLEEKKATIIGNARKVVAYAIVQVNGGHKQNIQRNKSKLSPKKYVLPECLKINREDDFSTNTTKADTSIISVQKKATIVDVNKEISAVINATDKYQQNICRDESKASPTTNVLTECLKINREDGFSTNTMKEDISIIPEQKEITIVDIANEATCVAIHANDSCQQYNKPDESIALPNKDILANTKYLKINRRDDNKGVEDISIIPEQKEALIVDANKPLTSAVIRENDNQQNKKQNESTTLLNKAILADCLKMNSAGYTTKDHFLINAEEDFSFFSKDKATINDDSKVICPICKQEYVKKEFKSHEKNDCCPARIKCNECGKLYPECDMTQHYFGHELIVCDICGTQVQRSRMRYHRWKHFPRVEKETEKMVCSICGKVFASKNFASHQITHGEKKHKCNVCGRAFHFKDFLERHMRSHTGEKPFSCNYCKRRFSVFWNLRQHERLHTNSKPYKCPVCPATYRHNVVLKGHITSSHTASEIAAAKNTEDASENNVSNAESNNSGNTS